MIISKTLIVLGLTGLFVLFNRNLSGQTQDPNKEKKRLIGIWGMFKDRHPAGWASWNPPYRYIEFMEDGKYYRTHLFRGEKTLIFGTYETVKDSLLVFHESEFTDSILNA